MLSSQLDLKQVPDTGQVKEQRPLLEVMNPIALSTREG